MHFVNGIGYNICNSINIQYYIINIGMECDYMNINFVSMENK